jgi:glycine cleavage system H protein
MNIPVDLKYTRSHEWIRAETDGTITLGITDHAQELLGDLVFIELPAVGSSLAASQEAAVVESVKAAADVYAPMAGTVVEVNQAAVDAPETVNQDAYTVVAVPDEADCRQRSRQRCSMPPLTQQTRRRRVRRLIPLFGRHHGS